MSIQTTKKRKEVAVKTANHPAAFKKVVCPRCKLGHAVEDFHKSGTFICSRCGTTFSIGRL